MSKPVEGGCAEQSVGEGVAPLGEIEVGGDDGGALFVSRYAPRLMADRTRSIRHRSAVILEAATGELEAAAAVKGQTRAARPRVASHAVS